MDPLSVAVRRKIGVVRLGGDDRNDRDLRLVYGSALDRLLSDPGLRGRIGQHVAEINLANKLGEEAKTALEQLDQALKREALPSNLDLGLTTSQGLSIGALIGLFAERQHGTLLPLSSWGAGTRRMAALQIAAATEAETRVTVIDEIERGLEPYRLRKLIRTLQAQSSQSFATTHSAVAISSAYEATLWYLDGTGNVGELPHHKIRSQQCREPETFLSRLAIIAEGPTEVGFVSHLLELGFDGSFTDHGVRVCDGQGNPATLDLLEAMADSGLVFGGFADHEGRPGRWSALETKMGGRLFRWAQGCTEAHLLSLVTEEQLCAMMRHSDAGVLAERRVTLAERLEIKDSSLQAIKAASSDLRALMIAAATGSKAGAPNDVAAKVWGRHGRRWFKSVDGGRELAKKMFALDVWPQLKPVLMPFINAIRAGVNQSARADLADDR